MNEQGASAAELPHVIDREVDLATSAINLAASGGAPSTMVVGLRLTEPVDPDRRAAGRPAGRCHRGAVGVGRDDQRHPRPAGAGMTDAHHLLLIEDDEALAGLLASHLRAHGYDVTVAPSAEAAEVLFAERAIERSRNWRSRLVVIAINSFITCGVRWLGRFCPLRRDASTSPGALSRRPTRRRITDHPDQPRPLLDYHP